MKKIIFFLILFLLACNANDPNLNQTTAEFIPERPALLDTAILKKLNEEIDLRFDIESACAFHPFVDQIEPERRSFVDRKKTNVYVVTRDTIGHIDYFSLRFDNKFKCYSFKKEHAWPVNVPLRRCLWK